MTLYLPSFASASQPMKGEIIIKADPKSNITPATQTEELWQANRACQKKSKKILWHQQAQSGFLPHHLLLVETPDGRVEVGTAESI